MHLQFTRDSCDEKVSFGHGLTVNTLEKLGRSSLRQGGVAQKASNGNNDCAISELDQVIQVVKTRYCDGFLCASKGLLGRHKCCPIHIREATLKNMDVKLFQPMR